MFYMVDAYERAFYTQSSKQSHSDASGWQGVQEDKQNNDKKGEAGMSHALGVLFGQQSDATVSVLDCAACLPHTEKVIDPDFMKDVIDRHSAMYPKEDHIGYFSFSEAQIPFEKSCLFHGNCRLYVWVRPSAPAKVNVFYVSGDKQEVISLPVEYRIEASVEEQMGLSRLKGQKAIKQGDGAQEHKKGDTMESGSLSAAGRELKEFLKVVHAAVHGDPQSQSKLFGRNVYVALARANLGSASTKVLVESQNAIDEFLRVLGKSDEEVASAEKAMTGLDLQ